MRKLFFFPSMLPKGLGLSGRSAVAAGLSRQLASAAICEGENLLSRKQVIVRRLNSIQKLVKTWLLKKARA
jgi:hypothetical protein